MKFEIRKATKAQSKARVALMGPPGSGKTYSALNIAQHIGARVIVIDTERGSASKYADEFDFEVIELESFNPKTYIAAIQTAEEAGADVIIIDSLSHAWMGKDGALEMVDRAASRGGSQTGTGGRGNSFTAWKEVTPLHNELVDTILRSRAHVFVTLRTKTEYVLETNERGKQVPRKVGLGALQREGLEYEMDVVAVFDMDNAMTISKTRCRSLPIGETTRKPGRETAEKLTAWLSDGVPLEESTEADKLRAKIRQGLGNIALSETHPKVVNRMKEQYGKTQLTALTIEDLRDLDAYINTVADKQAASQQQQPADARTTEQERVLNTSVDRLTA